jgi:hypothetical protein
MCTPNARTYVEKQYIQITGSAVTEVPASELPLGGCAGAGAEGHFP